MHEGREKSQQALLVCQLIMCSSLHFLVLDMLRSRERTHAKQHNAGHGGPTYRVYCGSIRHTSRHAIHAAAMNTGHKHLRVWPPCLQGLKPRLALPASHRPPQSAPISQCQRHLRTHTGSHALGPRTHTHDSAFHSSCLTGPPQMTGRRQAPWARRAHSHARPASRFAWEDYTA